MLSFILALAGGLALYFMGFLTWAFKVKPALRLRAEREHHRRKLRAR